MKTINYWDFIENYAKKYETLSDVDKKFAMEYMLQDEVSVESTYQYMVEEMLPKLEKTNASLVIKKYMNANKKSNGYYGYHARYKSPKVLLQAAQILGDRAKGLFLNAKSKDPNIQKAMLFLKNITINEEVTALRSVSTSKYIMGEIYESRYKPSIIALKKLPPIMRLRVIETLLGGKPTYNIVENIPYDDFKDLFFASTMKYRDRVERLCEQYKELCESGVTATVIINAECKQCGPYTITLTSQRARTAAGLKNTRLSYTINDNKRCALCGQYDSLIQSPNIVGDKNAGDGS